MNGVFLAGLLISISCLSACANPEGCMQWPLLYPYAMTCEESGGVRLNIHCSGRDTVPPVPKTSLAC